jgi:hypothetical protein
MHGQQPDQGVALVVDVLQERLAPRAPCDV